MKRSELAAGLEYLLDKYTDPVYILGAYLEELENA